MLCTYLHYCRRFKVVMGRESSLQMLLEMLELKVPFSNLKPQEIVRALMNGSPLPQVVPPPSFACAPSFMTPCHRSMSVVACSSINLRYLPTQ